MNKKRSKQPGTRAPMARQRKRNQTMENIMRSKTKGQDWSVARKKLITESLKRKPNYIKEPGKKKGCKTCG